MLFVLPGIIRPLLIGRVLLLSFLLIRLITLVSLLRPLIFWKELFQQKEHYRLRFVSTDMEQVLCKKQ